MSELERIISGKLTALDAVPDNFNTAVEKAQVQAFNAIRGLLEGLETSEGQILFNEANLARINQITNQLRDTLQNGEYRDALAAFIGSFDAQAVINSAYIELALASVTPAAQAAALLQAAKQNALLLLGDGAINQRLVAPVGEQLVNLIATGSSLQDAIKSIELFIQGDPTIDGKLLSYARTVADTAFSTFDRSYTYVFSKDLGVQWYLYSGSTIKTTRNFCCQRAGHYYRKAEVESWGGLQWAGQIAGTNSESVFAYAGGWNCRHSILPVLEAVVPAKYKNEPIFSLCKK